MCENIFKEIEQVARDASQQIRGRSKFVGGKIKLSKSEKLKWPFLQPSIDILKNDLREAKGTLMLMLQVTSLAFSKKMADIHQTASTNIVEQREIINAILAIQKQQQGSKDSKSNRLSGSSSGGNTPKAATPRTVSERSLWPYEESTLAQSQSCDSLAPALPIRPNVLVTIPSLDMPPPQLSPTKLPKSDGIKSIPKGCDATNRQPDCDVSSKSISSQTLRGGGLLTPTNSSLSEEAQKVKVLDFYILKPIVEDLVDVIQLSWKIHKVQMQQTEIQKQINKNEQDGLPAVHEVYQAMYTHEHRALENELSKGDLGVNLLSLKRIYVDLTHREILFKGIPGLQFILARSGDMPGSIQSAALQRPKIIDMEYDKRLASEISLNNTDVDPSQTPSISKDHPRGVKRSVSPPEGNEELLPAARADE
ncbi:MAG: hypothetical protein Q9224_006421, partial [Gallowayella concinna]